VLCFEGNELPLSLASYIEVIFFQVEALHCNTIIYKLNTPAIHAYCFAKKRSMQHFCNTEAANNLENHATVKQFL